MLFAHEEEKKSHHWAPGPSYLGLYESLNGIWEAAGSFLYEICLQYPMILELEKIHIKYTTPFLLPQKQSLL